MLAHPCENAPLALPMHRTRQCFTTANHQQELRISQIFLKKTPKLKSSIALMTDRELLAIYAAIRYFCHHLEKCKFTIKTDHKSLIYTFNQKSAKTSPRQRHFGFIGQFLIDIVYIPGPDNIVADALSRIESIVTPIIVNTNDIADL